MRLDIRMGHRSTIFAAVERVGKTIRSTFCRFAFIVTMVFILATYVSRGGTSNSPMESISPKILVTGMAQPTAKRLVRLRAICTWLRRLDDSWPLGDHDQPIKSSIYSHVATTAKKVQVRPDVVPGISILVMAIRGTSIVTAFAYAKFGIRCNGPASLGHGVCIIAFPCVMIWSAWSLITLQPGIDSVWPDLPGAAEIGLTWRTPIPGRTPNWMGMTVIANEFHATLLPQVS